MKRSPFSFQKHWLLSALLLLGLVAVSCTVPNFEFSPTDAGALAEHCSNLILDEGETGLDCGGTCPACQAGNTCVVNSDCLGNQCTNGICQDASCTDGVRSGTETDTDCGGGACVACAPGLACAANRDCTTGVCASGVCAQASCSDKTQNGDETDTDCGGGACQTCLPGQRCKLPTDCAGGNCTQGTCSLTCLDGKGNCDGDAANGCETNTKTDAAHCGACDTPCNLPHASALCNGGKCAIDKCTPPFADCDGDPSNGCEVNTSTDAKNCNACGTVCGSINGTPSCGDSKCQIACNDGYSDCDGESANGCETQTDKDVTNCGKCGKVCDTTSGVPKCTTGVCGVSNCNVGRGDCDSNPDDCETDTTTSVNNCGGCGVACVIPNGTPSCVASVCKVGSCNPGYADCDGNVKNGCETNIGTDAKNCGACNAPCSIPNATAKCVNQVCQVSTCTAPFVDCDGKDDDGCEAEFTSDKNNCGGCGMVCADNQTSSNKCVNEICAPVCLANHANCDGNNYNGCETPTASDPANCGGCNVQCKTQNASATACGSGACNPTCNDGFAACSNPAAGCLTSIDTAAHCGNCATSCTGGTPFCVSRACTAHLTIGVVNSSTVGRQDTAGVDLNLTHTLQTSAAANAYRLVVVGVTGFGNNAASLPTGITYNGVPMTLAKSFPPSNQVSTAIYYIANSDLPTATGTYSVVVKSAGNNSFDLTANVIELINVEQSTTPVDAIGGESNTNSCTTHEPSDPVTIVTPGAVIYSVVSVYGSALPPMGQSSIAATGQTITQQSTVASLGVAAGIVTTTGTGARTVGWNIGACSASSHALTAIRPAITP